MKMWYAPSLWKPPVPVEIIREEKRPDGTPIYIHSVTKTGKKISDYAQKFSKTKPARYYTCTASTRPATLGRCG